MSPNEVRDDDRATGARPTTERRPAYGSPAVPAPTPKFGPIRTRHLSPSELADALARADRYAALPRADRIARAY